VIVRLLLLVMLALWGLAAPAGAIPNTCPTNGPDAGTVNINEPAAGASFAGEVTVRGKASATAGINRVELFVGEALKDFQLFEPSQANLDYTLKFDAAGVPADRAVLSVVACGGAPGAAVRGIASIEVAVNRAAVSVPPPLAVTPVDRTEDRPGTTDRTGPAWVGAVFGLAGLAGLLAATRLRGAREATALSPAGGAVPAGAPGRRRVAGDGASPRRPSRAPGAPAGALGGAVRGRRAGAAPPSPEARAPVSASPPAAASAPASASGPDERHGQDGQDGQDGRDEQAPRREEPDAGDGWLTRRR
jgi:hypothetical protein